MAQLKIERGGHRVAYLTKFHVSVDGEEIAQLKHGESATVEVEPGTHSVQVHATGLIDGSMEVEIGGDTTLIAGSRQGIGSVAKSSLGSGGIGKSGGFGKKVPIDIWPDDAD